MKTFFKFATWAFIVFALSLPFVPAQSETNENEEINSIDDVKTFEDAVKYIKQIESKSLKSLASISNEEEKKKATAKYVTELGETFIKNGEKIISLTDDPAQQKGGIQLKITGLTLLQKTQELEKYFDELAKDGKFKSVVDQQRYTSLFQTKVSKELRENFTLENFAQYFQEAKKWANTDGIEPATPLLFIIGITVTPKALELDPEITKKTIDDIISFVNSDELKVSESKKKETISKIEKFQFQIAGNDLRENFTLENFAQHFQKVKKWANTDVSMLLSILEIAAIPKALELDPDIVKKTVDEILAFVRSDELKISEEKKKEVILQIEGFQKRFLGSNPELYGKTLDDQDFDWNKLRGKFVLVKFTASWCGPCKREIPFMLKAYEKYHDKGFEIVSVYVWDKLDATKKVVEEEKLNWIILSEELTEKAGLPKQGTSYAVRGVPTIFLVDKDGKIISTTVRGEKLEETLAKVFGETF
ncbi:MAG: TlpA family protein disulfide reductase [Planctomycetaceae bacterium]|jgi:thiol-disulfide isomerase/thioredoxin|nr:TlpA family protein disulfide reductase [Planctomycetaceae bacterium]